MKRKIILFLLLANCIVLNLHAVSVTFQVDMQNETVSNDSIFIRGSWNSWEPMLMTANGSVYSVTVNLNNGEEQQYKFCNGVDGWESIPQGDCTAQGNDNRLLIVPEQDTNLELVCFGTCQTCASLDAPLYTIREIQGEGDITPFDGQLVKTKGRIIAMNQFGCFIQDVTDIRSGIFIYDSNLPQQFNQGDHIQIIATAIEYNGKTELSSTQWVDYIDESFSVGLSHIEVAEIGEDYEGVFVAISNVKVISQNESQEYTVLSQQGDTAIIDNYLYQPVMEIGATYTVYGIVDYLQNRFTVNPRAEGGVFRKMAEVTFQVDMQNETVSNNEVYLNGDWENWENPILLTQNGTVYSTTLTLNPGEIYQFKFINGDMYETMSAGDCVEASSGNRVLTAPNYDITRDLVCFGTCQACANLDAPLYTIREIQGEGDSTPFDGQLVKTKGRIIAMNQFGCFIQDVTDIRSGIFIYDPNLPLQFNQGDHIQIIATASEYNERTQLSGTQWVDYIDESFPTYLSHIEVAEIGEDYEGVFVAISNVKVISQNEYQEYTVLSQQGDTAIIGNYLYQPVMEIGATYTVYGNVDYLQNKFSVHPRGEAGVIRIMAEVTFQVDMQNETVSNDSVFIRGSWNDWESMLMTANGSVYSVTVNLNNGEEYQYKFCNGADGWESIPQGDCTAQNNDNRLLIVPEQDTNLDLVCFGTCQDCASLDAPLYTISEIQGDGDITPFEGQLVKTKGRILAINQYGAFIQDTTWERSGIFIYDTTIVNWLIPSNHIQLIATASEYNGLTQLKDIQYIDYIDQPFFPVYTSNINANQIGEEYESVYVGLSNLKVLEMNQYNQYITVSEQNDTIIIDNYLFQPTMEIGSTYDVKGIVHYRYDQFRVCPRDENGLTKLETSVNITFQVDMQNETVSNDSVFIRGSWNDWEPMLMTANESIYSVTVNLTEGEEYQYKFCNGTDGWESISQGDCTAQNNDNRLFIVPNADHTIPLVCFHRCTECPPMVNITFLVDMQNETVSNDSVFVRGSWDSWATPIQLTANGTVYSAVVEVEAQQTIEYIFMNGDNNENVVGECTVVVGNYIDRTYSSSSTDQILDVVCFGSCDVCQTDEPQTVNVTFQVDMQNETVSNDSVFVRGNWDSWATPIQLTANGTVYTGVVPIEAEQTVEYIFFNGANREEVEGECTVVQGDYINRTYYTSSNSDQVVGTVCFGSCNACQTDEPPTVNVTFQVDMQNETVSDSGVYINGSWNNWNEPIKLFNESSTIYTVTLNLISDRSYEYKYVNGGGFEWDKYENPTGNCVISETGNRWLSVTDEDEIRDLVCFNSCINCGTDQPPIAYNEHFTLDEDSVISFNLIGVDSEDDQENLVFTIETQPLHSIEFIKNGNLIIYRPKLNYFGTDEFSFTVTDTNGNTSDTATVTLLVNSINDRPKAQSFTIDALGLNDLDIDLDNYISDLETPNSLLSVTFVPENEQGEGQSVFDGIIAGIEGTQYHFAANNPETGEDYIVYRTSDEALNSFAQVITISNLPNNKSKLITPSNEGILTVNDVVEINFGESIDLEFLGIDRTYPFEQLQMSILKEPVHGIFNDFARNEYGGSILTTYLGNYISTKNADAADSIVYQVYGTNDTITGVCYININSIKIAPDLSPILTKKMNEDETLGINLNVVDLDSDINDLTWNFVSIPKMNIQFDLVIENGKPTLELTPPKDYFGNLIIKAIVKDNDQLADSENFVLTVSNVNDLPISSFEKEFQTLEDQPFNCRLAASDSDNDSLTFYYSGLPDWITVNVLSKYAIELSGTPENKDVGDIEIALTIKDKTGQIEEQISIQVLNVDDAPYTTATLDTIFAKIGDEPIYIELSEYFADDDNGASISYHVASNTEPEIIDATITGTILELTFNADNVGNSLISIQALSEGVSVSSSLLVMLETGVGTSDFFNPFSFDVYPNPITDKFTIKLDANDKEWKLKILNVTGQLIYVKEIQYQNELTLDASIFNASGTYIIQVTSDKKIQTKKINVY